MRTRMSEDEKREAKKLYNARYRLKEKVKRAVDELVITFDAAKDIFKDIETLKENKQLEKADELGALRGVASILQRGMKAARQEEHMDMDAAVEKLMEPYQNGGNGISGYGEEDEAEELMGMMQGSKYADTVQGWIDKYGTEHAREMMLNQGFY